jgi:hypothetical protein
VIEMAPLARICVWLGGFLVIAGVVYAFTAHEPVGAVNLLVTAATFLFLAVVLRRVARGTDEEVSEPMVHVGPTIWPFGFAISGVLIALGLIVTPWILIVGGLAFAASAAGWLRAVARSHAHAGD